MDEFLTIKDDKSSDVIILLESNTWQLIYLFRENVYGLNKNLFLVIQNVAKKKKKKKNSTRLLYVIGTLKIFFPSAKKKKKKKKKTC